MKLETQTLLDAVTWVASAAERKTTLPIMTQVLVDPPNGVVRAASYQMSKSAPIPVDTNHDPFLVSASTLPKILKQLPGESVELFMDKDAAVVKSGRSRFRLPTMDNTGFPVPPKGPDGGIELDAGTLSDAIGRVVYAASADETRPHLNGVLVEVNDGVLTCSATDGHRVSRVQQELENSYTTEMFLPPSACRELAKIGDGLLVARRIGRSVLFDIEDGRSLSVVTVDDKPPPYEKVIPKDTGVKIRIKRDVWMDTLSRAQVMATDKTTSVLLLCADGEITIQSADPESGEFSEQVECEVDGIFDRVRVSVRYLVDAIKHAGEDAIVGLGGELEPIKVESEGYTAVVMPMRI